MSLCLSILVVCLAPIVRYVFKVLLWWDDEWVVWLVLKKWFVGWGKKKITRSCFCRWKHKESDSQTAKRPVTVRLCGGCLLDWVEHDLAGGAWKLVSAVSVFGRKFAHCWLKQISLSIDSATSERVLRTFVCLRLAKMRFQLTANHSRT